MARSEARTEDTVFPAALLRIALALKMKPEAKLEELVDSTVKAMALPKRRFQAYVAEHMKLLAEAANDFMRADRASRRSRHRAAPAQAVVEAVAAPRKKARSPR
jgi:hypothetical protein